MGFDDLVIDQADEFNTGVKAYPKDVINHVLMVWAIQYIEHSPTQFNDGSDPSKPCDVVVVDLIDLDQVDEDGQLGQVSRGTWWRQGRLIQKLRGRVGKPNPLLGRMTKGVGPNGAFELIDLSADEKALMRARAWWQRNGGFEPTVHEERKPTKPAVEVYAGSNPTPAPSPLERAAQASLGRSTNAAEDEVLDRLRRLGGRTPAQEEPPF
jgi:hypothetical protein